MKTIHVWLTLITHLNNASTDSKHNTTLGLTMIPMGKEFSLTFSALKQRIVLNYMAWRHELLINFSICFVLSFSFDTKDVCRPCHSAWKDGDSSQKGRLIVTEGERTSLIDVGVCSDEVITICN